MKTLVEEYNYKAIILVLFYQGIATNLSFQRNLDQPMSSMIPQYFASVSACALPLRICIAMCRKYSPEWR